MRIGESFKSFFGLGPDGKKKLEEPGYNNNLEDEVPDEVLGLHEHLGELESGIAEPAPVGESLHTETRAKGLAEMLGKMSEQEKPAEYEKLRTIAVNMIEALGWRPEKEDFLVITDDIVVEKNPWLIHALQEEINSRTQSGEEKVKHTKGRGEIVVVSYVKHSAAPLGESVGEKMFQRPVLILTAKSRSHSKETGAAHRGESFAPVSKEMVEKLSAKLEAGAGISDISLADLNILLDNPDELAELNEKIAERAKKDRMRVISVTKGNNPFEILTKGAVEESMDVLKERAENVKELMKDVVEVHITAPNGTDLKFKPRVDKEEMETGDLSQPGALSNWPVGEWSCSPLLAGANGTLVADGPIGGGKNLDQVKQNPQIVYEFKDGVVVKMNGKPVVEDTSIAFVEEQKKYLQSGGDKGHGFRIAEFGVGTNAKACEGKPDEYWGSSEGEKRYGTVHIATGSNGSFGVEKDDPNFNDCDVHCDNIIGVQVPITVECTRQDGSKFFLIKDGQPQGY